MKKKHEKEIPDRTWNIGLRMAQGCLFGFPKCQLDVLTITTVRVVDLIG